MFTNTSLNRTSTVDPRHFQPIRYQSQYSKERNRCHSLCGFFREKSQYQLHDSINTFI